MHASAVPRWLFVSLLESCHTFSSHSNFADGRRGSAKWASSWDSAAHRSGGARGARAAHAVKGELCVKNGRLADHERLMGAAVNGDTREQLLRMQQLLSQLQVQLQRALLLLVQLMAAQWVRLHFASRSGPLALLVHSARHLRPLSFSSDSSAAEQDSDECTDSGGIDSGNSTLQPMTSN